MADREISGGGGIIIDTPEGMAFFRLAQMKGALSLELKGLKHSQGSVYALVKRELGFRGSKQRVYDQLCAKIEAILAEREGRKVPDGGKS